jgi:small-conductance mechanosensitive channel
VETDVRFKIDRLFRERNIEIAFPQQDIHIRSGFKDEKPVSPQTDSPDLAGVSGKGDS